jgi:NADH dehydrogenase FAD-containing subunit
MQLGYLAAFHGKLVAKNIQAALQGKPLKPWKPNGGMSVRCMCMVVHVTMHAHNATSCMLKTAQCSLHVA